MFPNMFSNGAMLPDGSPDPIAALGLEPDREAAVRAADRVVVVCGNRQMIDIFTGVGIDRSREINHDVVCEYKYYDTKLEEKLAIRVMELLPGSETDDLSCNIKTIDLDDPGRFPYEAISYMWRDEHESNPHLDEHACRTDTIYCQGASYLKISKNLNNSLRRLRQLKERRLLWIDQVCINQNDEEEKVRQMSIMQHVYLRAAKVLLWAGEEDEYTTQAFDLIHTIWKAIGDDKPLYIDAHPHGLLQPEFTAAHGLPTCPSQEWEALANLFKRQVFRRAWIIQEVILGNISGDAVEIICGSHNLTFFLLLFVARFLVDRAWARVLVTYYGSECRPIFLATLCSLWKRIMNKEDQTLQMLVASTRRWDSTHPEDKLFSLIGLSRVRNLVLDDTSELPGALIPDIRRSTVEVFRDATIYMIQSEKSLDILSTIEDKSLRKIQDLPSWVPDYSVWPQVTILRMPQGIEYRACGDTDVDCYPDATQSLNIRAAKVDKIAALANPWLAEHDRAVKVGEWQDFIAASVPADVAIQLSDFDHFGRTLVANYDYTKNQYPVLDNFALHYGHYFASHIKIRGSDGELINESLKQIFAQNGGDEAIFSTAMGFISYLRRLFISEKGRLGLAPISAEVGDDIVVLSGGRVPFVMRSMGENKRMQIMAECYLHRVMDGEALEEDGFEWGRLEIV